LEERFLLSTYVVTSTVDDGSAGTLRDAITQANLAGSTITEIDFNIGKVGEFKEIWLPSQLPALTANGVFINGLSQGGSGNTARLIELVDLSHGITGAGLLLQGSGNIVSGLDIDGFTNSIEVAGANNTIGGTAAGADKLQEIAYATRNGRLLGYETSTEKSLY
jgi:hypothetical protein